MSSISAKTSSSTIWKKIQAIQHKRTLRSIVLKVNGSTISQPGEVADILANEYSQRSNGVSADESFKEHKKREEKNMISFPHTEPRKIYNKPFVMEELLFALKSSSKAPGPDNIVAGKQATISIYQMVH